MVKNAGQQTASEVKFNFQRLGYEAKVVEHQQQQELKI